MLLHTVTKKSAWLYILDAFFHIKPQACNKSNYILIWFLI